MYFCLHFLFTISEPSPPVNKVDVKESSNGAAEGSTEEKSKSNLKLVDVYSNRICAVTHAFALCCSTIRKSTGG